MTNIDIAHIPYNGGGAALAATLAGETHMFFANIGAALPVVKDGRLRGLAVSSAKRTTVAPDFPTIAESGVPGFETTQWYAVVAPAQTPKSRVSQISSAIGKTMLVPEFRKRIVDMGADPVGSTPDELASYIRSETGKWANVIKAAGIKPE